MEQISKQPNLYYFDTYPKRYYATVFNFEFGGKRFRMPGEYGYGNFAIGVFVKLIRQYFAKRTPESNTVLFEGVPVSSLEDLQNISIVFDFNFKNDNIGFGFHYIIRNTDTGVVIAEDSRNDVTLDSYGNTYEKPISPADCNKCDESDYVFNDDDFDDEYEYDMMAAAKAGFQ
jgi:hypothetical protein